MPARGPVPSAAQSAASASRFNAGAAASVANGTAPAQRLAMPPASFVRAAASLSTAPSQADAALARHLASAGLVWTQAKTLSMHPPRLFATAPAKVLPALVTAAPHAATAFPTVFDGACAQSWHPGNVGRCAS